MATQPVLKLQQAPVQIPQDLREFLHLQETETHYAVRTQCGATLLRPKSEIEHPWQLLRGILDDNVDHEMRRKRDREWELNSDRKMRGE